MFNFNPFDPKSYPKFESVYDSVPSFGRTRSLSYRLYKGAKMLNLYRKVEVKAEKRKFRAAVTALKLFHNGRTKFYRITDHFANRNHSFWFANGG